MMEDRDTTNIESVINAKPLEDKPKTETGIKEGTIVSEDTEGTSVFKYKVKPKCKLGKLVKGDFRGAFEKSSLQLSFDKDYTDDNVEISVKMNGNLAMLLNSPPGTKNFQVSASVTKHF